MQKYQNPKMRNMSLEVHAEVRQTKCIQNDLNSQFPGLAESVSDQ